MYNTSNPAEIYPNTTWELLASDKYLKTTTGTPLSTGGSNSFTIQKANLPAVKVQLESFQLGKGTQEITGVHGWSAYSSYGWGVKYEGAFYKDYTGVGYTRDSNVQSNDSWYNTGFQASRSWTGMSTSASPYTQNLGSGSAISINPAYITTRAWKRLS